MLTNRRSTMTVPPSRMPSWHPHSKPLPPSLATPTAALTFENLSSSSTLQSRTPSLLTSTTPTLPGHTVRRTLGAVHGTTTLFRKDTKSFLKNLAASFSGSGWGEARSLTALLYQARDAAVERMVQEAVGRGANAVIGVRVRESEVLGCVVISVEGTGVWVERIKEEGKRDSAQEGEQDPFQ